MMHTLKLGEIDPYRWGTVFAVLSLDLTTPYASKMCLQLPPRDSFITGLRKIITQFRAAASLDPEAELPFAKDVFRWSTDRYGVGFSSHLYLWGTNIFQYGNGASAFLWNNVIRTGGLDGSRDESPPPDLIRAVRLELSKRISPDVQRNPTSSWDRELYMRQGYDELMNPSEFIKSTISYCNFVCAWQGEVARRGNQINLEEIYRWGAALARRLGMPIDRLGMPGKWPLPPPAWT
jgi:hypothetical protein